MKCYDPPLPGETTTSIRPMSTHTNPGLRKMRRVATGALILCAAGAVTCRLAAHFAGMAWLGWPGAFFEAGMVGAMADWFAVVALFRHPLGIPIPHTAVLPKNKGRVADSLATFISESFLTEEQLGPRLRRIDYAGFASRWLQGNATMIAARATAFAPTILDGLSDEEMTALLGERARDLIRQSKLGPIAATALGIALQNGRDREIFVSVLRSAGTLLEEHRTTIQEKIAEEIPLSGDMLRGIPFGRELAGPLLDSLRDSLAGTVAKKTIEKTQATLEEAARNPQSSLWNAFDKRLRELIENLKSSPEMTEKIRTLQDTLAKSTMIEDFAQATWREIKTFLLRDCAAPSSLVRRKIEEAVRSASNQIMENEATRKEINAFVGEEVLKSILTAKPHAQELITSTVNAWDSQEMATRLEGTVGRDLQFIRLNGTIVGGLVGLAIHTIFWALQL